MKIDNSKLKSDLSLLSNAVLKDNTARPITKMIELSTKNGFLYGYTNDGINSIGIKICPVSDDFTAIINFATLYDIVKVSKGDITLKATDKFVTIKTDNLSCKIPNYTINQHNTNKIGLEHPIKPNNSQVIDFSNLKNELDYCKAILNPNFIIEAYKYIYFNDNIMVTDTDNVAIIHDCIFNKPILLSLSSVNILTNFTECNYEIFNKSSTEILGIYTDDICVNIKTMNTTDFQYDDLLNLFNESFNNKIVIENSILSEGINACKLFKYDPKLVFNNEGVSLKIPSIEFTYIINNTPCNDECSFNISTDLLKKITVNSDLITIEYDKKSILKCISDKGEQIFSVEVN